MLVAQVRHDVHGAEIEHLRAAVERGEGPPVCKKQVTQTEGGKGMCVCVCKEQQLASSGDLAPTPSREIGAIKP